MDGFSDGILSGEQVLLDVGTKNRDAVMGKILLIAEKRTLADIEAADAGVKRVHASHAIVLTAGAIGNKGLLVDLGRHACKQWNLVAQVVEIVSCHLNGAASFCAPRLHFRATVPKSDLMPAKALEGNEQAALEAIAVSKEQNDRGYAPSHPQHGEEAAATVVFEGRVGLG